MGSLVNMAISEGNKNGTTHFLQGFQSQGYITVQLGSSDKKKKMSCTFQGLRGKLWSLYSFSYVVNNSCALCP